MLARTWGAAIQGIGALTIWIETNATGLGNETKVMVVGLPDAAVRNCPDSAGFAVVDWADLRTSPLFGQSFPEPSQRAECSSHGCKPVVR